MSCIGPAVTKRDFFREDEMSGSIFRIALATFLLAAMPTLAIAQSDAPISFAGQTLTLIVPNSPGSSHDFHGRLIARHMPKYLPGNPDIVVQNIPGSGGIKAISYFLEVNQDADLTFTTVNSSLPFAARSGKIPETLFDPRKMPWIGSSSDNTNYCGFGADTYNSLDDLQDKEFTLGAASRSSMSYSLSEILAEALGWKNMKLVSGYDSPGSTALAIERGEIDGVCASMVSYAENMAPLVERGIAKIAFYFGPRRRSDIDAPYLFDLPMAPDEREFVETALTSVSFGRPFALHPDADPRLLPIFRQAFEAALKDPELLAEAEKANVVITLTSGEELEQATSKLYETPDKVIAKIATIVNE
jgi:tripartite-type tricarboxylate transporter receptor subunit TctC